MSQVKITNLSFSYLSGGDYIFKNLNLILDTDWKLALIGRNGKGKTTFFKLLMNEYEYSGNISKNVSFSYFPYEVKNENLNVLDIASEMIEDFKLWELQTEMTLLDLNQDILYRSYTTLSMGERTKFLIAVMFLQRETFLLIDEPTNHLDEFGRTVLSNYLKNKHGFIVISHDRAFIDNCADHILAVNKNTIELMKGNYSAWEAEKTLRNISEQKENFKLSKEIKRLEKGAKQARGWSSEVEKTKHERTEAGLRPDRGYLGHKSAKMMKHAKNIEARKNKSAADKSLLLKDLEYDERLTIRPVDFYKNNILTAIGLSIYYKEKCVVRDLDFDIKKGERLCVKGVNGSGKSSLLKLIANEDIAYEGELIYNKKLTVSYLPQEFYGLKGNLFELCEENELDRTVFFTNLNQLGLDSGLFMNDMASFSFGQKKKVLLSVSITKTANLYVWDEPLNYIDVISRRQIEEMLINYKPTIIFVEHDKMFCENVATKFINL